MILRIFLSDKIWSRLSRRSFSWSKRDRRDGAWLSPPRIGHEELFLLAIPVPLVDLLDGETELGGDLIRQVRVPVIGPLEVLLQGFELESGQADAAGFFLFLALHIQIFHMRVVSFVRRAHEKLAKL